MLWTQSIDPNTGNPSVVKLICLSGSLSYTIPLSFYPPLLTAGSPVIVNITEVVSYDGYALLRSKIMNGGECSLERAAQPWLLQATQTM